MHTIKYEFAVHLSDGKVCWFNSGAPGSIHDLKLLRENGLLTLLGENGAIIGDSGYCGEPQVLTPFKGRLDPIQLKFNKFIHGARALVERVNARMKKWHCISDIWRHQPGKQELAFRVCLKLFNLELYFSPL